MAAGNRDHCNNSRHKPLEGREECIDRRDVVIAAQGSSREREPAQSQQETPARILASRPDMSWPDLPCWMGSKKTRPSQAPGATGNLKQRSPDAASWVASLARAGTMPGALGDAMVGWPLAAIPAPAISLASNNRHENESWAGGHKAVGTPDTPVPRLFAASPHRGPQWGAGRDRTSTASREPPARWWPPA